MNKIKVLVFPAGEVNSIELHDALASCVNIEVWGASSIERHGSYVFENYIPNVPFISDSAFFESFNKLLEEKKIDIVFPTHDTVALFLAQNADKIKSRIIVSDKETASICRDKEKTYLFFADCDFIPQIFEKVERYPVFIKPREGQGAVGAKLLQSKSDLSGLDWSEYVISEYLPGSEYTVDCFTDRFGNLRFVSPRSRRRTMAGISVAGRTEKLTKEIQHIAEVINERLSFLGLWWFQIKQDCEGRWKLLEISMRCAGTMALTRALGVNLPLLSVYTAMGFDVSVSPNSYDVEMDSNLIRRYRINYDYNTVYFDFDDTLIIRGKVNLRAVWFLYQCRNQQKKIILLTKHEHDLLDSMKHYCIPTEIFNDVVCIPPEERKVAYIYPEKAIFIDNAWQERNEVSQIHGIPVFDVDGLDTLMDWRC